MLSPNSSKHGSLMDKIGLYVHWPYCARICPYCDFNIYKTKTDTEENLVTAILEDMKYWRAQNGPRALVSIHFGGGTPSLISPENLQRVIDLAVSLWTVEDNLEVGLEANPKDISMARLKDWRSAGIERLSIGVQSFDDEVLKFLGRDHDGMQALAALEQAVKIMPRVSADLIYGWTEQSLPAWQKDLETATSTGAAHISAYQLTIEKRTAFARAETRGDSKAVGSDKSADLYELGLEILGAAGFIQYEVSNFAKTADARSRHNLLYWQGEDYIGVGPGAHGRLTTNGQRTATIAALKPQAYIKAVLETGHGMTTQDILTPNDWAQEYVLMGLRISDGISKARYREIAGHDLNLEKLNQFSELELFTINGDNIAATPKGRLVLDSLSHELLS